MTHDEIRNWLRACAPTLLAPDAKVDDIPPGWEVLLKRACLACHEGEWVRRPDDAPKLAIETIAVREGHLHIDAPGAYAEDRGRIEAARVASAEICDRCGAKGDPVEDGRGRRTTRCARCRMPEQTVRARRWPPATTPDHPHVISPGQYTSDIRGMRTGADWDESDWRNYGRLETLYAVPIAHLMRASDDEQAMRFWAGGPGWAGLLRALFITLRPEQDERPDDPDHSPWRLRWMKEKWGELDVRTAGATRYQRGVTWLIERLSVRTCLHCGAPGEPRLAEWVRPECEACWAKAPARDHEWARRWKRNGE